MPKNVGKKKIRLGVNIDHAATLRQVRDGKTPYPDMLRMAELAVAGGAALITIHLREDRRHIQEKDLALLAQKLKVPLNLEMAATWEMVRLARKYRPHWCCFVPEKRQELTTEGGLNILRDQGKIARQVAKLQFIGIETSMFIEPDLRQVQAAYEVGADAIELHTGRWVLLKGRRQNVEWQRLTAAANLAHDLGMNVHAGHGLCEDSIEQMRKLPFLEEVNIGHALICSALEMGLKKSVARMRARLA